MAYRVVVVDDEIVSLMLAKTILEKEGCRIVQLKTGRAMLEYVKIQIPDLILLDYHMPEMNGLEALEKLRELEKELGIGDIPVIFLTGTDDAEVELKCLEMGAMDFIRKPFTPKIMSMRVFRCIELRRLQLDLEGEVEAKTIENQRLAVQIVQALAGAIDAKDTYTNGHSSRVAEYSRMIAERLGFSESRQNEIYMMGLLHDVGQIGIPDDVINKTGKLTDKE